MDDTGRQQPAYWDATGAGKHLIAATNRLFCGSGIQFKLKEVRSSPMLYPYLTINGSVAGGWLGRCNDVALGPVQQACS
jgi:hypothetical protein